MNRILLLRLRLSNVYSLLPVLLGSPPPNGKTEVSLHTHVTRQNTLEDTLADTHVQAKSPINIVKSHTCILVLPQGGYIAPAQPRILTIVILIVIPPSEARI